MGIGGWVVLAIIVALAVWAIGIYNGLVTLRNRFKNAFSQIDVQLKRRYDLIPNLVEVAKGYIKHERETLEAVIAARNSAVSVQSRAAADPTDPSAMKQLMVAEGALTGSLGRREPGPALRPSADLAVRAGGAAHRGGHQRGRRLGDRVLRYHRRPPQPGGERRSDAALGDPCGGDPRHPAGHRHRQLVEDPR